MTPEHLVKVATTPDEIALCLAIRRQVFVEEQGIPAALDADGLDDRAVHVLVSIADRAAATGRLVPSTGRGVLDGVLARIAVLPEFRDRGLGGEVVRGLEAAAEGRGIRRLTLHPHEYLERFYRRLGYRTIPGTTVVGEHTLITMEKTLGDLS